MKHAGGGGGVSCDINYAAIYRSIGGQNHGHTFVLHRSVRLRASVNGCKVTIESKKYTSFGKHTISAIYFILRRYTIAKTYKQ